MKLLSFGYARLRGLRNTQYVLANPEADKHKAFSDYLAFFGFGYDPALTADLRNQKYIKIPITSDSLSDQTYLSYVLDSIVQSKLTIDPGNLYALHKACDTITSLNSYRWTHPPIKHLEHFSFNVFHGFDIDGSNFLYLIFDKEPGFTKDLGIIVKPCESDEFAGRFKFFAHASPAAGSVTLLNQMLGPFIRRGPTTANMQNYPTAGSKFNDNFERYMRDNDIVRPSKDYLDSLKENIRNVHN